MQDPCQMIENVDFQWSDLAHALRWQKKFVLRNGLQAIATRCIQIDPFDQFHIIQ